MSTPNSELNNGHGPMNVTVHLKSGTSFTCTVDDATVVENEEGNLTRLEWKNPSRFDVRKLNFLAASEVAAIIVEPSEPSSR